MLSRIIAKLSNSNQGVSLTRKDEELIEATAKINYRDEEITINIGIAKNVSKNVSKYENILLCDASSSVRGQVLSGYILREEFLDEKQQIMLVKDIAKNVAKDYNLLNLKKGLDTELMLKLMKKHNIRYVYEDEKSSNMHAC